jgi:hypothetical protein
VPHFTTSGAKTWKNLKDEERAEIIPIFDARELIGG